jgi:hypothetical protein
VHDNFWKFYIFILYNKISVFFFFFFKVIKILLTERALLKYTLSIQEKHPIRKRKNIKKIMITRNMKAIIGGCHLVKGFEEESL